MKKFAFRSIEYLWKNLGYDDPITAFESLNITSEQDIYDIERDYKIFEHDKNANTNLPDINPSDMKKEDLLL